MSISRPWVIFLSALSVVIALAWAINLDQRKLAKPDEGRYAEIARNMAQSGDYITPRLNGLKYFYKPPLQYWATAWMFEHAERSEWSARWWVTFCALFTAALVAFTARRIWGTEVGVMAGAIVLGSPYFAILAQINTLDMGVTAFTTMTFCALLLAWHHSAERGPHQGWLIVAWAGAALAILSKGLIGLVFPAGTLLVSAALQRNWRLPFQCFSWPALTVFFLIAAPWFILVARANPEFAWFFFVQEHVLRYLTPVSRREAPFWYFVPIVAVGLVPWTGLLFAACRDLWTHTGQRAWQPCRVLAIWAALIVAFFSASSSKLPAYVLPAFPALAMWIAVAIHRRSSRQVMAWLAPMGVVTLILAVVTTQMADRRRTDPWTQSLYNAFEPYLTVTAVVMTLAITAGVVLLALRKRWQGIVVCALGFLAAVQVGIRGYEELSPLQSAARMAHAARPFLTANTRLYAVEIYDQTLPFYLDRTFLLVNYVDEFELGIRAQPERALPSVAAFVERWKSEPDAIAIMHPGQYDKFVAEGVAMEVIVRDPRRVLVRKPQWVRPQ